MSTYDDEFDERIAKGERASDVLQADPVLLAAVKQFDLTSTAKDRTQIVQYTTIVYALTIGTYSFYLLLKGLCQGESVSDDFSSLIQTSVVPIVTFVIGYYFKSGKDA